VAWGAQCVYNASLFYVGHQLFQLDLDRREHQIVTLSPEFCFELSGGAAPGGERKEVGAKHPVHLLPNANQDSGQCRTDATVTNDDGCLFSTAEDRVLAASIGRKELPVGVVEVIKKILGVPKEALVHLAHFLLCTIHDMADLLPVTERTLQRYSPGQPLNRVVSEHLLQMAEVAAKGVEVFADKAAFLAWLHHPNTAMANHTPLSLLSSRFGAEMVLDELGRLEHGIVA
jgi:putative toxin-antitoxin system antitoxin component (TIGR02293 family)